jgi:quercetin dioxygenase-like cupin family protein
VKLVRAEDVAAMTTETPAAGLLVPNWLEGPHTAARLDVGLMSLGPGAVTPPHVHLGGQVMVVTSGRGFVETDGDRVELAAGDVVICPPGELHTHGADHDHAFAHLTVTTLGYTFPSQDAP